MSSIQSPVGPRRKTPGSRAVPVGVTLIVVAIAIGVIGSALTIPRFDDTFSRDVIINGATNPRVPGRLAFRIAPPVSGDQDATMTVGVAVESQTLPQPTCELSTSEGRQIPMSVAGGEATLYRQSDNRMRVVGLAKLKPGSYVAKCDYGGSDSLDTSTFTVGHALDASNLSEFAPVFWFIGVAVISGLMFVVGVITLTIGVFRKNRARRQGIGGYPGGPRPGGPYPPGAGGLYPGGPGGPYPPGGPPPGPGGPYPGGYPAGGPSGPPQGPG
ncbi:MAG: hypothetical protein WBF71_04610, partial [Microthrixaceae bacterium]